MWEALFDLYRSELQNIQVEALEPKISAKRDHAIQLPRSLSIDNFTILGSNPSEFNLRILESIFPYKCEPKLNNTQSAVP